MNQTQLEHLWDGSFTEVIRRLFRDSHKVDITDIFNIVLDEYTVD